MTSTVKELIDELGKYPPDMKLTFGAYVAYGGESVTIRPGRPAVSDSFAAPVSVEEYNGGNEVLLKIISYSDNLSFEYEGED